MKTQITILVVLASLLLTTSCSTSQNTIDYQYEFVSKSKKNSYTEVYNYKYGVDSIEWNDIDIFVTNYPYNTYIFVIDLGSNTSSFFWTSQNYNYYRPRPKWPKAPNTFIYYDELGPKNFRYTWETSIYESVNDLEEAIILSLQIYLQNYGNLNAQL